MLVGNIVWETIHLPLYTIWQSGTASRLAFVVVHCSAGDLIATAALIIAGALALTADRVDLAAGVLVIESLKKRRTGIFRAVPVPLPCSRPSTWSTASASCRPAVASGFGVAAVIAGIPLNLVQKWLGHAQLTTTAIYANAVDAEEKDIARRMWG